MGRAVVGTAVPRKEAWIKVTGAAEYVDDVCLPGMLHGATIRSTIPLGRIKQIRFADGAPGTSSPSSRPATSPAKTSFL